jgi:hypothetical protein
MRIAYPMSIGISSITGGFFILLLISIEMSLAKVLGAYPDFNRIYQKTSHLREVFCLLGFLSIPCRAKECFFEKEAR